MPRSAPRWRAARRWWSSHPVANTDRSVGAFLAGEIARAGGQLPRDHVTLRLTGHAGQSLAAWAPTGLRIDLEGACNDYAGKGLCGGVLTVRPFEHAGYVGERSVLVGNTVLYGATGGEAFLCGPPGAVRGAQLGRHRGDRGRRRSRLRVHDSRCGR